MKSFTDCFKAVSITNMEYCKNNTDILQILRKQNIVRIMQCNITNIRCEMSNISFESNKNAGRNIANSTQEILEILRYYAGKYCEHLIIEKCKYYARNYCNFYQGKMAKLRERTPNY